jgi:probable rRNA maturation factor
MRRSRVGRAADEPPSIDVASTVNGAPPGARVAVWTRKLLAAAPQAKGRGISVLLCGDARMRSLNREWRKIDRPTDVLSFPSDTGTFLGDVVVDVPYAARQARERGHSTDREVQVLLAHGVLHLLGYDHETDDGEMFRLQRRLVRSAFGPGPDGVPESGSSR